MKRLLGKESFFPFRNQRKQTFSEPIISSQTKLINRGFCVTWLEGHFKVDSPDSSLLLLGFKLLRS